MDLLKAFLLPPSPVKYNVLGFQCGGTPFVEIQWEKTVRNVAMTPDEARHLGNCLITSADASDKLALEFQEKHK